MGASSRKTSAGTAAAVAVLVVAAAWAAAAQDDCDNVVDRTQFAAQPNASFAATLNRCADQCYKAWRCTGHCFAWDANVTTHCSLCFGRYVQCVDESCFKGCGAGSLSAGCLRCQAGECWSQLVECAHVPAMLIPHL
eukprot:m51a1_g8269 hypothetical protein (137) ;mRNA; r:50952-51447